MLHQDPLFCLFFFWDYSGGPVVKTPRFHCRGAQVGSMVRELRSSMLCDTAKKKKWFYFFLQCPITPHYGDPVNESGVLRSMTVLSEISNCALRLEKKRDMFIYEWRAEELVVVEIHVCCSAASSPEFCHRLHPGLQHVVSGPLQASPNQSPCLRFCSPYL